MPWGADAEKRSSEKNLKSCNSAPTTRVETKVDQRYGRALLVMHSLAAPCGKNQETVVPEYRLVRLLCG